MHGARQLLCQHLAPKTALRQRSQGYFMSPASPNI